MILAQVFLILEVLDSLDGAPRVIIQQEGDGAGVSLTVSQHLADLSHQRHHTDLDAVDRQRSLLLPVLQDGLDVHRDHVLEVPSLPSSAVCLSSPST